MPRERLSVIKIDFPPMKSNHINNPKKKLKLKKKVTMDGWMDENIYLPTDERVASPESGGAERAMCGTLCVSNL